MRLTNIAHLYLVRLKARVVLVQELFAVLGIAVGVALLFASQVASTSLDGSVAELTGGVVGKSQYQIKARSPNGFSEGMLGEVQRLPGVRVAVPTLERQIGVIGPSGRESVDLLATDPRFVHLVGPLLRHFSSLQLMHQRALALPASVAQDVGVRALEVVRLQIGGRLTRAIVGTELTSRDIGSLADSPIVLAPLSYAQKLTGMRGRISRVFVQPLPGRGREALAGLRGLAAGRFNVEPADYEAALFSQAATPVNQSTDTFAAICALVGFMFAFCAMLLTTSLRQALVTSLRRDGTTRWGVIKALLFDAFVLGAVASLVGLVLGEILSVLVFSAPPGFLSIAFPVGSQRIVTWQSVVIAVSAGLLAAVVGVLAPMRDIWAHGRSPAAAREHGAFGLGRAGMLGGGIACLAATTVILLAAPQSAILGIVALVLALLLLLPLAIDLGIAAFDRLQRPLGMGAAAIAAIELRSPTTRARSIAVAATAAIAVFGAVTIQGSHSNLQHGLDRSFQGLSSVSDLWVDPAGTQSLFATVPFEGREAVRLARLPGVASVGRYFGGFLEYGGRRIWVLAPPASTSMPVPASQLVGGRAGLADARLRAGGWAVISKTLATQHHLHVGDSFVLPAPRRAAFRVAALTTNLGWPPGAVILGERDYVRAWQSAQPSAYNVMLTPGADGAQVRREIAAALGPRSGLVVQTAAGRQLAQREASRQGLGRLTQIALLVLLSGVLATATVMGAMIWQRRRRFARMKVQGYERRTLWRALLCESALLLATGCLLGAAFGVYGQLLLSHALQTITGFPLVFSINLAVAVASFAIVVIAAAAIIAVPGYRAASVRPYPWASA